MIVTQQNSLYLFFYLLSNIIRMYAIFRFMNLFFDRTQVNRKKEVILFVLYFFANSLGFLIFRNLVINLLTNIILCFLITCMYPGQITGKLLSIGVIYGVSITWDTAIGSAFPETDNHLILSGFITVVCILLTELIFERFSITQAKVSKYLTGKWMVLFIIPGISILWAAINHCLGFGSTLSVINILGFLFIDFIVFWIYSYLVQESELAYQNTITSEQHLAYKQQNELMKDSLANLRQFQHDIKKHTDVLLMMLEDSRPESAIAYLQEMSKNAKNRKEYVCTGIPDLDAILNYKFTKADDLHIRTNTTIAIPSELGISIFDLNTILTNLLDNAIDAAADCSDGYIEFSMQYSLNILSIYMDNSYSGCIQKKNGKFISHKTNKEEHGYGITSIEKTTEKYNGCASFTYDDQRFHSEVHLYI